MAPLQKLEQFLKDNNVSYKIFHHAPVRTSEEADSLRPDYSLSQGAKAIIIKAKLKGRGRRFYLMVLPGNNRLDSKKVRKTLNAKSFSFASRDEVLDITEGVKPGGVHPFGNLFGLEVFVDKSLSENKEIIFNAGDRSVSIALDYQHFLNSIQPEVASFTE